MKILGYIFAAILITIGMLGATCGGMFIFFAGKDSMILGVIGISIFLSIFSGGYNILKKTGEGEVNLYFLGIFGVIGVFLALAIFYSLRYMSFGG